MQKDPVKTRIRNLVIVAHVGFLLYVAFYHPPVKNIPKPLVVKTVQLAAPKEKVVAQAKPSPAQQKKEAIEKPKPAAKKPPEPAKKLPPIVEKKVAKEEKKLKAPKKAPDDKRERMSQKLLQDLEESLAKLDEKPSKKPTGKKAHSGDAFVPSTPYQDTADFSNDYHSTLMGYLKQTLNLPEYGEVKIQLTLKQDGTLVKLVVLKTESEKNRKYLEGSLPHLRFPQLSGKKNQETFIITFCNEL
jgi:outer membrane biosynthesis protein TonB